VTAVERAFVKMDVDNDGTVAVSDVVNFLSELKPHQRPVWAVELSPVLEKKMTKNLKTYDHDGDHQLSLPELTEWWYSHPTHKQYYDEHDKMGVKAGTLEEEDYIEELPPATSFEALRRTEEPRVRDALEEIVIGEMEEASEEALEDFRESLEDKPAALTVHAWINQRSSDGQDITPAEKAYRDMKKKPSGHVSIAEITKFFLEMDPEKRPVWAVNLTKKEQNKLKKTLAKYDRDGDNELTIEELVEWWACHPAHSEAYGDKGVHTLFSVDDMVTPRSPKKEGGVVGI